MSCHGPNGRFTLSCAASVFGTQLMPYFVNSTSIVSNNVIRRYIRVKFKVKVNLGQSSCYFDLRSNFQLNLPRSKKYIFQCNLTRETRWRLNYSAIFLSSKVICENKTVNLKIAIFFSLTRPGGGGVKIWPKEVNSGTTGLRTSQGVVWSSSHSFISIRGEMTWEVATPPPCAF